MDRSLPGASFLRLPKQEYWSGLPRPPPGDTPDPGIWFPTLQVESYNWVTREAHPSLTTHFTSPKSWGKLTNQMVKEKEQTFLFIVVSTTLWLSKSQLSPWLTSTWICGSEKDGFFLFLIISIILWSLKKAPSTTWKVVSSCFGGMNGFMIMVYVLFKVYYLGLPAIKNSPVNARNMGSIPVRELRCHVFQGN